MQQWVFAFIVGAIGVFGPGLTASAQAPGKKPNIVIIWGDDIGQTDVSVYSHGLMGFRTPNIDRVARDGMLFTDYYAEQSCTAGRSAFITGQSVFRTGLSKVGIPGADIGLRKEDPTIAELLKPLGYATGQFGKNHLGDKDEFLPTAHGFDEFYGNLYHLNAEEDPEHANYPKDTDIPGFRRVRNIPVMGESGSDYFSHAEVVFESCRVPQSNRLGAEGEGFVIAQQRLGPGRIHHCMRWIGICERAFDLMCRRACARELSPGRPLGGRQIVQQWIAVSRAEINAARLLVLDAAEKIERAGATAAREEISIIKFHVANVLDRVLDRAIQAHGALGITDDLVLAWWYRHERGARIYDGPDEVHQSSVARLILKRYGMKDEGADR